MIEIRKGVPKPAPGVGRRIKYPWLTMDIDDSFLFDGCILATARSQAWKAGKRYGRKFSTRKLEDGTIGCWRDA